MHTRDRRRLLSLLPPLLPPQVSLLHCMPQGLQDGGAGLGMMWGRQKALAMLKDAGFAISVDVLELEFDTFNDCYLCAKGPG